eukprot:1892726-Amphidinium_carterae.1
MTLAFEAPAHSFAFLAIETFHDQFADATIPGRRRISRHQVVQFTTTSAKARALLQPASSLYLAEPDNAQPGTPHPDAPMSGAGKQGGAKKHRGTPQQAARNHTPMQVEYDPPRKLSPSCLFATILYLTKQDIKAEHILELRADIQE